MHQLHSILFTASILFVISWPTENSWANDCKEGDLRQNDLLNDAHFPELIHPIISDECLKVDRLDFSENIDQRERQFDAVKRCEQNILRGCAPNLKNSISQAQLMPFYAKLRSDPLMHQMGSGGDCEARAYLINKKLTEMGFQTRTLFIQAPTIVGQVYDDQHALRAVFNYRYHAVPVVNVTGFDGTSVPTVLDPSFSDKPLSLERYSLLVTGQNCSRLEKSLKDPQYRCVYTEEAANYRGSFDETKPGPSLQSLVEACGWSLARQNADHLLGKAKKPPEPSAGLPFTIDSTLGPERSAIAWGLDKYEQPLLKNRNKLEAQWHELRLKNPPPSPRELEELGAQLTDAETRLSEFASEKKRILRAMPADRPQSGEDKTTRQP